MEIKFLKTIDEWVKSNPDDEIIARVLSTVNKGDITEIRKKSGRRTARSKRWKKW
jgi:hypothetical protein